MQVGRHVCRVKLCSRVTKIQSIIVNRLLSLVLNSISECSPAVRARPQCVCSLPCWSSMWGVEVSGPLSGF